MKPAALRRRFLIALLPLALAACGGGDDGPPPLSCSVTDQKAWLSDYFDDWYFWYYSSPRPSPAAYSTVGDYFNALLYTGTDPQFPDKDRWSFYQSTESFNRFFGDGQSLGYGVSVAGNEAVLGATGGRLYVRYVEPNSPAAGKLFRGDEILSINGRSAASMISAAPNGDFSVLAAANVGDRITVVGQDANGSFTVDVFAGVFTLAPVPQSAIVITPLGRKMGYVVVKDMLDQALTPLDAVFAGFKTAGVTEIVLDLRYNGGGLVRVGNEVASYVAGTRGSGKTYASLLYNDKRSNNNQSFLFDSGLVNAAGVSRVFVLTGARTASAAEQVINGLLGIGVNVISIGDTTYGKPVGFLPQSDGCGTTYNVVNFESVNARNEGRYFNGFDATCPVAEDFTQPLGSMSEPLLAAAASYADSGGCPAAAAKAQPFSVRKKSLRLPPEPGDVRGMIAR